VLFVAGGEGVELGRGVGQGDDEAGAAQRRAVFDVDGAAVHLNDAVDDGEAGADAVAVAVLPEADVPSFDGDPPLKIAACRA